MGIKINLLLISVIFLLLLMVLFIDNESLNSLFVNYEDNLVISEVSVLSVDDNNMDNKNENNSAVSNDNAVNNSQNTPVSNNQTVPNIIPTVLNNVASSDYWAWPTDGNYTITSYYSSYHKALDIYQGYGSNIYAANNGVVTMVKGGCVVGNLSCNGRGGNYVVINHNSGNYYTLYMHLKDIRVSVGDVVSRGQVIGTMGNTGNVIPVPTPSAPYLGTHLHFCLYIGEPYRGGYAVNPMRLY